MSDRNLVFDFKRQKLPEEDGYSIWKKRNDINKDASNEFEYVTCLQILLIWYEIVHRQNNS